MATYSGGSYLELATGKCQEEKYVLNPAHSGRQFDLRDIWSPEVSTHVTYPSLKKNK